MKTTLKGEKTPSMSSLDFYLFQPLQPHPTQTYNEEMPKITETFGATAVPYTRNKQVQILTDLFSPLMQFLDLCIVFYPYIFQLSAFFKEFLYCGNGHVQCLFVLQISIFFQVRKGVGTHLLVHKQFNFIVDCQTSQG